MGRPMATKPPEKKPEKKEVKTVKLTRPEMMVALNSARVGQASGEYGTSGKQMDDGVMLYLNKADRLSTEDGPLHVKVKLPETFELEVVED